MSTANSSDAFDPVKTFGQLLERDDVSPRTRSFALTSTDPAMSTNSRCRHPSQP
jgi:hypothetical protein